jgi:hypothetical protein
LLTELGIGWFFCTASPKRERENIGPDELLTLREIGAAWLTADAARIAEALKDGALQEVSDGEEDDEENDEEEAT